jgi:hypothetical protein
MTQPAETLILDLLSKLPPGKSIGPEAVARAMEPEAWHRALPRVKEAAKGMARAGALVILRHNKPADPNTFKGVWRMRLP